jgi:hypothetical protein
LRNSPAMSDRAAFGPVGLAHPNNRCAPRWNNPPFRYPAWRRPLSARCRELLQPSADCRPSRDQGVKPTHVRGGL